MVVKIRFISLVNLIMNRKVVEELIQENCNTEQIFKDLLPLLDGNQRDRMLQDYEELALKMGLPGASERTAKLIIEDLER
jgi:lipid-A-disaccharide synthase